MRINIPELAFAIALTLGAVFAPLTSTSTSMAQAVGNLTISNNWIRATPPAAMAGGGFLTIENSGTNNDTLISVEFNGAKKSEIHEMKMDDGIMKMRPLYDGIVVPAGGKIELKPGGFHLMFMRLKDQLKDGQTFPVKLTFANAGEITLDFPVLDLAKGRHLMMHGN